MRRCADGERGGVVVEWAMGVAVLVLPVAMLVAVFPSWAERQSAARLSVREAARVAALADDPATGIAAGHDLALSIAANHGIDAGDVRALRIDVPIDAAGLPLRGGHVTASLEVRMRLVDVPFIGATGGVWWPVSHRETIDRYRSFAAP